MSIQDVKRQFIDESGGKPTLHKATMRYENGGAVQVFSFDCGLKDAIEVECPSGSSITAAVSEAVRLAKQRAEKS